MVLFCFFPLISCFSTSFFPLSIFLLFKSHFLLYDFMLSLVPLFPAMCGVESALLKLPNSF